MNDENLVAPSLKVDLGFSLVDFKPSLSVEIPLPATRRQRDRFALPFQRWRVKWRAYRDAKKALPNYERNERSATETEIIRLREMRTQRIDRKVRNALLDASEAIDRLTPREFKPTESLISVRNSFFSWLTSYQEFLAQALYVTVRNKATRVSAKERLDTFREEVGGRRLIASSVRPQAQVPFLRRMGLLLFAGIFESVLSVFLFRETSEYGLVGVWWNAATISALNIGHGLLTGYLLMRLLRVERGKVVLPLGITITIINTCLALWANFFVAHYRAGSDFGWSSIFPPDAMSAVLLVIGITVWLFSVYKGWNDLSPDFKDHADLWDEYQGAEKSHEGARTWYLTLISNMRQTALAKLDSIRNLITHFEEEHRERLVAIRTIRRRAEGLFRQAHLERKNITSSCDVLLKEYRETNFVFRKDLRGGQGELEYVPEVENKIEVETQALLDQATEAEELIKSNSKAFSEFRQGFESEVAEELSGRVQAVEEQARESFERQDSHEE